MNTRPTTRPRRLNHRAVYRREVGARLRLVRLALAQSAQGLAAEFDVKAPRWSQWEHGHHLADLYTMVRLARRYGVSLDYLYNGDESNLPKRLFDAIKAISPSAPGT